MIQLLENSVSQSIFLLIQKNTDLHIVCTLYAYVPLQMTTTKVDKFILFLNNVFQLILKWNSVILII